MTRPLLVKFSWFRGCGSVVELSEGKGLKVGMGWWVRGQAHSVVLIHVHLAVGFTTCFCLEQSLSVFPSCQESLRRCGFRSWTLRPRDKHRWTIIKGNPGSQLYMFIHQDVAIDKEIEHRRYELDRGWVWHGPTWGTFGGAAMRAADPATRSSCSPMMGWRR